jgi:hypothetical protein
MIWEIAGRGFLPSADPSPFLSNVQYRYADLIYSLENLAAMLPVYLAERRARDEIVYALRQSARCYDDWVPHDIGKPADYAGPPGEWLAGEDKELERALMIYAYLASAYVHARGETTHQRVPKEVAVPLFSFANKLGRPPILSYASQCLYNWRRKDPTRPIRLDNLETLQNFTCGEQKEWEDWYVLVHVAAEAAAAPALGRGEADDEEYLGVVRHCLAAVNECLGRLGERCPPDSYAEQVYPYTCGFNRAVLECVENERCWYLSGASPLQSALPAFFALVLGVPDTGTRQREYMPPAHREFLGHVRGDLRDKALRDRTLRGEYNGAVGELATLRAVLGGGAKPRREETLQYQIP